MRIIITAGPTREYIDSVRFISNASSGQMGLALAETAANAGHDVTLLAGPGMPVPGEAKCEIVPFTSVDDLRCALEERFDSCDVLIMAAAVGDFRIEKLLAGKLPRSGGPVELRLVPTEDILAGIGKNKRKGQIVIAFAVEDAPPAQAEEKARTEMQQKNADYVVVNPPSAMGSEDSLACILSPTATILPWETRPKHQLAAAIVNLLGN